MRSITSLFLLILLFFGLATFAIAGNENIEVARIQAATWSYVIFAVTVTTVKIVALVLGYFIVKLGYNTMMAGVQGKDSVEFGALGTEFKFKGVTPGLALGVIGILMMAWSLSTKHQFSAEISKTATGIYDSSKKEDNNGGKNNDKPKSVPPDI